MAELKKRFPDGVDYKIAYDTTPFIRESVADVVKTLFEAVVLVGLVVLVFLQNWRSVLIPMIAVPVAIIGTFAAMAVVGFSLNNISLFGLVLAIGIVVDDAIVVVENVDRWLDHGLPPREAAQKAMAEVTGPDHRRGPGALRRVRALRVHQRHHRPVLPAVRRDDRRFHRLLGHQLADAQPRPWPPSCCGRGTAECAAATPCSHRRLLGRCSVSGWFFPRVQRRLRREHRGGLCLERGKTAAASTLVVLLVYAGPPGLDLRDVQDRPPGLRPAAGPGPDHRQRSTSRRRVAGAHPGVRWPRSTRSPAAIPGRRPTPSPWPAIPSCSRPTARTSARCSSSSIRSTSASSPNCATTAIMNRLRQAWAKQIKDAQVLVFGAPPVPGLSVAGGFKLVVEDRGGLGLAHPGTADQRPGRKAAEAAEAGGRLDPVPLQYAATLHGHRPHQDGRPGHFARRREPDAGGSISARSTSTVSMPSAAIGRSTSRPRATTATQVADINLLEVRNNQGQMVPLGTLVNVREIGGPIFVYRYNLHTAASITGSLRPGVSSGDVIADVDRWPTRRCRCR